MHTAIIGLQFGDEGKGKLVDRLAENHDVVVRYSGGANAGHTVIVGEETYKLHLIPCGVIHGKPSIIGSGVVVNLDRLDEEMQMLAGKGIELTPKQLLISERAHLVTPYQLFMDLVREMKADIGTTLQGIGPTYEAKTGRRGLRTADLLTLSDKQLEEKIKTMQKEAEDKREMQNVSKRPLMELFSAAKRKEEDELTTKERMIRPLLPYTEMGAVVPERVLEALKAHRQKYAPFITNTALRLDEVIAKGERILFESAQGTLLDVDHGTYPHVTSSNPTIGGIYTGTGIHCDIPNRIGVIKAYTTRVGNGPFPTKITGPFEELVRENGHEYGTTTGRNRDIGWLDIPALQHAIRTNGINQLAITKIDTLDLTGDPNEAPKIKVCVAYEINGKQTTEFPATHTELERAKPVYREFERWTGTADKRTWEELPRTAKNYLEFLTMTLKVPIKYVSTGAEREQTIII